MSTVGSYPVSNFSPSQYFLIYNPSTQTLERVLGSELVTYVTQNADYVRAVSTRAVAQTLDFDIGIIVQTGGDLLPGDGGQGTFLVVASGDGTYAMNNGNDLLLLPFGSLAGSDLDGALVTDNGVVRNIEDAITDRPVMFESFAAIMLEDLSGYNAVATRGFYGSWSSTTAGPKGGATYHRDGTTGTASTAYSDNSGFYDANGDGFRLPAIAEINVLQFGAKGDGSTDDTTAIVNANAFGEAIGHCKLTFPYTGSAYIVTSGSLIIATDFTDWIGDGGLVEIKCTSATGDVLKIEGNDVNIYRLYINGDTGTRVTSGRGVYMDNGESFTQHRVNLIDCQILNQPGHGIEGVKQENARHENLWIQSCGGKGFYFHDNGGVRGINCTFINCRAYACGSSGDYQWHIYNQTAFTFENCQSLDGTHTYEVFIQAGTQHKLNGFDLERTTSSGSGMLISGSNHKVLIPLVRNFVTVGIDVNSGTSVDIENPRIISNTATPVGIGIRYTSSSGRVRYNDSTFTNVTTSYSESGTSNVQRLTRNVSAGVDNRGLREVISSAATMTPDAESGGVKQMTLDQNLTINAPTNPSIDAKLRFNLIQGGVGGYTTTWDSIFKFHTAWSDAGNTTGTESTIEFVYTGSKWMQTQTQTGWTS